MKDKKMGGDRPVTRTDAPKGFKDSASSFSHDEKKKGYKRVSNGRR